MEHSKKAKELYEELCSRARDGGYLLNPDRDFTMELMEGLVTNTRRYGYPSCPCRLAEGVREKDLDIICPCDYRDPDLSDHGACYCGLYVSQEVSDGEKELAPVPERRPADPSRRSPQSDGASPDDRRLSKPVFRCRVCGYLCARDAPPGKCPICGVASDRFERFM